jgi:hypothetical protein
MDRFTWGIVVGAVLLVAAGLVGVTIVRRPAAAPDLSTPEGVVRAYVTALDTDHSEQAWDLLSTGARAGLTREEFIRRTTAAGRPRFSRVAMESVTVEGDTARVELSRTYEGSDGLFGSSGYTQRTTVRLERENGAWRISVPPDQYLFDRSIPPVVVTVVTTPVAGTTPTGQAPSAATSTTPTPRAP